MTRQQRVDRAIKRTMDLIVATAAAVLLLPLITTTAIAVLVNQGRPILFRQIRPGLNGVPFTIVKFRTMRAPRPDEVWYRTDEQRLTRLGRFLRSTSIDELPELWNVIRGDMSLVGPRPLLMDYLDTYTPRQRHRHDVPPGITSWAIVNGRHTLGFEERLEMDVWYVEHWSLSLDVRILLMTVSQVLRRAGVVATQEVDEIGFPLPDTAPTNVPRGEEHQAPSRRHRESVLENEGTDPRYLP